MTPSKPTARLLALIAKQYAANESRNLHSENVTLLAEHFGTPHQQKVAKVFADVLELLGYQTSDRCLREKHDATRVATYEAFVAACGAAAVAL